MVDDAMVDEELGLDGVSVVDEGDRDEDMEAEETLMAEVRDIVHEDSKQIDALASFDTAWLIKQLREFNTVNKMPSEVRIHLDRFAHSFRQHKMQ